MCHDMLGRAIGKVIGIVLGIVIETVIRKVIGIIIGIVIGIFIGIFPLTHFWLRAQIGPKPLSLQETGTLKLKLSEKNLFLVTASWPGHVCKCN